MIKISVRSNKKSTVSLSQTNDIKKESVIRCHPFTARKTWKKKSINLFFSLGVNIDFWVKDFEFVAFHVQDKHQIEIYSTVQNSFKNLCLI